MRKFIVKIKIMNQMSKKIDLKDRILLNELKKNAKCSSRSLAKRVGLPISTVYRRMKRLKERGIIKKYTIHIDYEKIGKPVQIFALINVEEGEGITVKGIKNKIRKFGEVEEVLITHGWNFDLIVRSMLKSVKNISEFLERIRKIEGVEEVSSIIVE